jgi:hypothetical protein
VLHCLSAPSPDGYGWTIESWQGGFGKRAHNNWNRLLWWPCPSWQSLIRNKKLIWTTNGAQWKVRKIVFLKLYVMCRCKKGCNTIRGTHVRKRQGRRWEWGRWKNIWRRCSSVAHDPYRKLGLRMGQSQQCDICMYSSVHMYQCINESWLYNSSNFAIHYNYFETLH